MTQGSQNPDILRIADLSVRHPVIFDLAPNAKTLAEIATELDLAGLRKLRFHGSVSAQGKNEWLLRGELGATVVQPCVITLAPVTSRIDEPVIRRFAPEAENVEQNPGEEIEMPEDDTVEPLGTEIDLRRVMIEALALTLPAYPRTDGAELGQVSTAEEGATPLSDEDTKPFAQLAALRAKLRKDD